MVRGLVLNPCTTYCVSDTLLPHAVVSYIYIQGIYIHNTYNVKYKFICK